MTPYNNSRGTNMDNYKYDYLTEKRRALAMRQYSLETELCTITNLLASIDCELGECEYLHV
jgi:hypothetical protein